jgi:hypothetical protein
MFKVQIVGCQRAIDRRFYPCRSRQPGFHHSTTSDSSSLTCRPPRRSGFTAWVFGGPAPIPRFLTVAGTVGRAASFALGAAFVVREAGTVCVVLVAPVGPGGN